MEEKIVSQLVSRGSIPAKTTVNSVGISEGVCYLDLNSKFMNSVSNVSGEVALYSLVTSPSAKAATAQNNGLFNY